MVIFHSYVNLPEGTLYTAQSVQYVYNMYIYIYILIFGSSVSTVLSLGAISLGT